MFATGSAFSTLISTVEGKILRTAKYYHIFDETYPELRWIHQDDHVIAFERGDLLFVFNFAPESSYTDYPVPVSREEDWQILFSSDDLEFGGFGRNAHDRVSACTPGVKGGCVRLYLPARTALVLCPAEKKRKAK